MSESIEKVKEWINKADHDLGSAKIIFLNMPDYFDTIAFHCQQAVEKYLKSILISLNIEFKRSHDLIYLLELINIKLSIDEELFNKAIILNGFSVEIRYPNQLIFLSKEELEEAIEISEEFRAFAFSKLGLKA